MSSHEIAVAEADETNVQQTLDSLLVLPFNAQPVFGGDDRLDVPCFGQSHHVQIVIDHDQLGQVRVCEAMKAPVGLLSDRTVLRSKMEGFYPDKFRACKAVRFDAEDGFGVRGFPEQLLQQ